MCFFGKKFLLTLALVVPIGCTWLCSPVVLGQNNNQQRPGPAIWGKAPTQPEVRLREPMELADLPKFSGHAVFLGGHLRTTGNGDAVLMSFKVKESPDQVRDWYSNVLHMGQWKVMTDKEDIISARKNDNTCTVSVSSAKNREYPTALSISYFTGNGKPNSN
jgi:hypothetical protein